VHPHYYRSPEQPSFNRDLLDLDLQRPIFFIGLQEVLVNLREPGR
jgi:hypothetical protein